MQKKGAAMLIETILLIGFVILSTIAVYSWAKSRARDDTTKIVSGLASSLDCADIKIAWSCDGIDKGDKTIIAQIINNTGQLRIENLLLRKTSEEPKIISRTINPGDSIDISKELTTDSEYEIIPLVEKSDKFYLCKEKGLVISSC